VEDWDGQPIEIGDDEADELGEDVNILKIVCG